MKTALHVFLGILILSGCSISTDTLVVNEPKKQSNENLFNRSKLSEKEIEKINSELLLDTLVEFPKPLDSTITSPYNGSVQLLYSHRRDNIEHFINTVLVAHESIKDISYTNGKIVFNVLSNDEINYYEDANYLAFSWRYYYAHDIYGSFFSYDDIDTVVVLMEGELDTWLPTSGDTDGLKPPHGYMLKRWYIPSLNYIQGGGINIDDADHFQDYDSYVVKESVLDSIGK